MSLDARLEVRLTLEHMQAQMLQFVRGEVMPELEGRIKAMVADIDLEVIVREMVRQKYRETVQRLIEQAVHSELWKREEQITRAVKKAIASPGTTGGA